jgi:glutathione synthase/RimK-type ligase-like ATP-grasp enzyme
MSSIRSRTTEHADSCRHVIIFAASDDIHARAVEAEINKADGSTSTTILDPAAYPGGWQLNFSVDKSGPAYSIDHDGVTIPGDAVVGVWCRRMNRHAVPPEVTDAKVRQFCLDESRAAFQGWLHSIGDRVINPWGAESMAAQKPYQLSCAFEAGLTIPESAITNSPAAAERFLTDQRGGAIFKVLTGTSWQFTETRQFEERHRESLSLLRFAPAIFQQKIDRGTDIRVTIVDNECFAVAIQPNHPGAELDWRLDLSAEISPYALPPDVHDKLLALMRQLGLRYGAADLRIDPNGEHVFLEVNPGGQFLFCEIHANQPISAALARALTGGPHRAAAAISPQPLDSSARTSHGCRVDRSGPGPRRSSS